MSMKKLSEAIEGCEECGTPTSTACTNCGGTGFQPQTRMERGTPKSSCYICGGDGWHQDYKAHGRPGEPTSREWVKK